jgi:uncharacterized protein (DUF1499 family)
MLKSKLWIWIPVALVALYGLALLVVVLISERPDTLGVEDGELAPCPSTLNCVSTQSDDAEHGMEPLTYNGSDADAHQRLLNIIEEMPRTRLIEVTPTYIYAEFRTPTFRFVDDVEFYISEASNVIHFRSASRLGESDLGLNRRRMEGISQAFATRQ